MSVNLKTYLDKILIADCKGIEFEENDYCKTSRLSNALHQI